MMKYGLIGNCKTSALIHESGSIDWCCLPNMDSHSVFARLLDPSAGHFQIESLGQATPQQQYLEKTNILQTNFKEDEKAWTLTDFMPRFHSGTSYYQPVEILRLLKPIKGNPKIKIKFHPRLNYARGKTHLKIRQNTLVASHRLESVYLYSSIPLEKILKEEPFLLEKEEYLLLSYHEKIDPPSLEYSRKMFDQTKHYWETWSDHCKLPTYATQASLRSALTLKLMVFEDTGAMVAAPTTSLPEIIGEERNWDYRYCWIRDASLMLETLKSIGHFEEAKAFIHFLLRIFESKRTKVQIVYSIHGRSGLKEKTLPHLQGYKNSKPVRIGNHAYSMRQNDIFGEMINTLYLFYLHYQFEPMTGEVWSLVKFLVHTIVKEWKSADAGIWEYRNRKAHFTFSKLLSWVALDRGAKIAAWLGRNDSAKQWQQIAQKIKKDILQNAWSEKLQSFTQAYGTDDLDASVLLMNLYGFIEKEDPHWISTVERCEQDLLKGDFGFRYIAQDDFGSPKSSFVLATFWLAKALFSIGKKKRAFEIFDRVVSSANHLGLLSEVTDPHSGELLGNFPQAYSHMGLINTAHLLSKDLK